MVALAFQKSTKCEAKWVFLKLDLCITTPVKPKYSTQVNG